MGGDLDFGVRQQTRTQTSALQFQFDFRQEDVVAIVGPGPFKSHLSHGANEIFILVGIHKDFRGLFFADFRNITLGDLGFHHHAVEVGHFEHDGSGIVHRTGDDFPGFNGHHDDRAIHRGSHSGVVDQSFQSAQVSVGTDQVGLRAGNGNEGGINCGLGVGKIAFGLFKLAFTHITRFEQGANPFNFALGKFQITPTGFKPGLFPVQSVLRSFTTCLGGLQVGLQLPVFQPNQQLSFGHGIPFVDEDFNDLGGDFCGESHLKHRLDPAGRRDRLHQITFLGDFYPHLGGVAGAAQTGNPELFPEEQGAETGQNDQNDGNDGKTHENHLRNRSILRHGRPAGSVHRLLLAVESRSHIRSTT